MRFFILSALLFVACSVPTPVVGPQGDTGPAGDAGPMGPQGPVGPQGPQGLQGASGQFAPVRLDAGTLCLNGGVLLSQFDGGGTVICDGATGPIGSQGIQGIQGNIGPQGNVGATGPGAISIFDVNNSRIGPGVLTGGFIERVFVESAGCSMRIDWANNVLTKDTQYIGFTAANCNGTAFAQIPTMTPDCIFTQTTTYRISQPVLVQTISPASMMVTTFQSDGGVTSTCSSINAGLTTGIVLTTTSTPTAQGPFFFGTR